MNGVRKVWGAVAIGFGVLTVFSGFSVLFGGDGIAALAGNVVTGVLWFNALSGFVYIAAGLCLYRGGACARPLATGLALALALVFAALGWHIVTGGAYEMRTVGAMVLRLGFWLATAVYLSRIDHKGKGAST